MAQKKRRPPRRSATRSSASLSLAPIVPASAQALAPLPLPDELSDLPDDEGREIAQGVVTSLLKALGQTRHRMDAELAIASIFGTVTDGLDDADDLRRIDATSLLLKYAVASCLQAPSPEALGLLLLLADQGPAHVRELALDAAQQLQGLNIAPPRWAQPASLVVQRTWLYGDVSGVQSSCGIHFSYGHREHTLMVLIDHDLGGGIKDTWFVQGSDGLRAREGAAAMAAENPGAYFRDIEEKEALGYLQDALSRPACPEQPDQIEDVDAFLYLTHTRSRQLAERLGAPDVSLYSDVLWSNGGVEPDVHVEEILQVKVSIVGSKPPTWRRLELPDALTLPALHQIIQAAFGWSDKHSHEFVYGTGRNRKPLDEALDTMRLFWLLKGIGEKATYTYGPWQLTLECEKIFDPQEDIGYPRCTGGRRAAPPNLLSAAEGTASADFDVSLVDAALARFVLQPPSAQDQLDRLVALSADLKAELLTFARSPRFSSALDAAAAKMGSTDIEPEAETIEMLEHFMLRQRFDDGRTLVEKFVDERPELSRSERAMLLDWVDPIEEVLQVERVDGQSLVATSVLNDLPYRVRSSAGLQVFRMMAPGSFVTLKLVPLMDEWLISGVMVPFPVELSQQVLSFAARRSMENPELVFRNPQTLEKAWEVQRKDRAEFLTFFGTDTVILPGAECREQLQAFRGEHAGVDASGQWEELGLPDDEPVAMIYDDLEGLGFFTNYHLILAGFANTGEIPRDEHAELLLSYLTDDSIGAGPLRRVAERYPDTVDRVYQQALGRRGFSWVRDGENLLREFKPFAAQEKPRIVPLTPRLVDHVRKHGMD
ncbi:plasmid pRiA4b ORF-3 family protein [Kineosporia babensis]|uniref:Plasmid pRiA4b ORF-3 family protein n=1 Tax=Kineosporia babensis TaxID=499548 RepID=A0A9X1NH75_9ACTN|nr:plasmid pRiA4b ORF-3 family protein [Kineosporia babensis]MCD5313474.1 plasmid pRiA4b ORF-3 family protein [Kineosporia babensis]